MLIATTIAGTLGLLAMNASPHNGDVSGYYLGLSAMITSVGAIILGLAKLFTDQAAVKKELETVNHLLKSATDQIDRLAEENRRLTGHAVKASEGNSAKLDTVVENQRKSDSDIQRVLNEKQQRVFNRSAGPLPGTAGDDVDKTPPIVERPRP